LLSLQNLKVSNYYLQTVLLFLFVTKTIYFPFNLKLAFILVLFL